MLRGRGVTAGVSPSPEPVPVLSIGRRVLFLLIALVGAPCAGQGSSIILTASGPAVAGSVVVINVLVTGEELEQLVTSIELNGVPLPASSIVIKPSESGDGSIDIHVRVPSASAGGTLTATASTGSAFGTLSLPVQPPAPPQHGSL